MNERLNELLDVFYKLRSRVLHLSGNLKEMAELMMYINDDLNSLRNYVIKLGIAEEGKAKLLSLTSEYQVRFLEILIAYAKDEIIRKLNTIINDLTNG